MSEWLVENWSFVSEHPAPLISFAIICMTLGFVAAQALSRERISTLKEKIELYKQKLDGVSPDEAAKRIRELELKLNRLSAMYLDEDKVNKIVKYLAIGGPERVTVSTDMVSTFGDNLAEQLDEIFQKAGWTVNRAKCLYDGDHKKEIVLQSATRGPSSGAANRVEVALRLGEIEFQKEFWPDGVDNIPEISFRA